MTRTYKKNLLMLCIASLFTLVSCSDEVDLSNAGGIEQLPGQWQCTWSMAMSNVNIAENAYVGTLWKFGTPTVANNTTLGSFQVALDGTYNDTVMGEYHFYDGDSYWLPSVSVWISEDNEYYRFHGFHEFKPGEHYQWDVKYWAYITDSTMTLFQYDEQVDNVNDATMVLKFKRIES